MGKLIKLPDGRLEFDVNDESDRELVKQVFLSSSFSASIDSISAISNNETIQPKKTHVLHSKEAVKPRTQHSFPPEEWELIGQTIGSRRSSTEHNVYLLYQNRQSGELVGIEKSGKNEKEKALYLDSPNEEDGIITRIKRAVESMPFKEPFSRRKLAEALPSNLSRPELIKFAIVYLKHIGLVREHQGKEIGTGAKQYVRIKEKEDSSRQESDQEAAGTILR